MSQTTPSLKLIVVDPENPHVVQKLAQHLVAETGASEVRAMLRNSYVVNTVLGTSELRDLISSDLDARDSCLVVEFETWSGYGPEIDSAWLMRRGH